MEWSPACEVPRKPAHDIVQHLLLWAELWLMAAGAWLGRRTALAGFAACTAFMTLTHLTASSGVSALKTLYLSQRIANVDVATALPASSG